MTSVSFADTVSGGGSFQNWSAGNLDEDGKPYWDTTSFDGTHQSIGYLLTDGSPTPLPDSPGAIPFYGQSYSASTDTGGGPVLDWSFNRTAPQTQAILKLEISARAGVNEFGWYDTQNPGVLNSLFAGAASAGAQAIATPAQEYGFYIRTTGGVVYRTQSSLNPLAEQGHQHFSLFRESALPGNETYWLGIEDLSLAELNGGEGVVGDYNDMVIRLQCIPEPRTIALLGLGFCFVALLLGRRSAGLA